MPSALEARLRSRLAQASSRPWASDAQRIAREAFLSCGLPQSKEESWRFTPLRPTVDIEFLPSLGSPDWGLIESRADAELGRARGIRLYLAGNRVRTVMAAGETGALAASASMLSAEAPTSLPMDSLGVDGHHGFALASEALAEDAALVTVRGAAATPLEIEIVVADATGAEPAFEAPQFWIDLEANSSARLTELHLAPSGSAPLLRSTVGRIRLGAGAALEHARVLQGVAGAHSVELVRVQQGRDSRYRARVATFGGSLSRLDLCVRFVGSGAECDLEGLYTARSGEIVDHHTLIDHQSGGCSSRQRFKGIATEDGRTVFDGTVVVRRDAQKSVARQENRNLVLSEDAVVHTKPHLEIDADDVVCSHGATVGRLSADEVFYLRSRGIDGTVARAMLTHAFGLEVLNTFENEPIRRRLENALLACLPEGVRLEALP